MKQKLEPLTEIELEKCMRWARTWFLMARKARELGEWRMGDRFAQVAEDIFDRLEATGK